MGTRKKTSELVFNLQWRNKPDNGGDKSNVIGMYDTPTTTSNFDMFKSYLLKNSGVAGDDVKVTYITDNGQEWVIDSQEWFEIALSAFRLKARLGEVISLKLDRISTRKHSNDVETQSEDSLGNEGTPPEWFVNYMKQFKRDIVEEVTYSVNANLTASGSGKEKEIPPIILTRKIKPEASKRSRRHLGLGETPIDKEFLKTLKYDRKLENKLDKLDAKTKKIKEKKQALIGKIESEEQKYFGKSPETQKTTEKRGLKRVEIVDEEGVIPLLNASLVNSTKGNYERMIGGEVYLHTWDVVNSGKLQWPPHTVLRLTWGSADLVPSVKSLRCPLLKPGEFGSISVRFHIPTKPGTYESYWNFYDKDNVRFGHSLGCSVVVERPLEPIVHLLSPSQSPTETKPIIPEQQDDKKPIEPIEPVFYHHPLKASMSSSTPEKDDSVVQPPLKMVFYRSGPPQKQEETPKMAEANFYVVRSPDDFKKEREASLSSSVMDLSRRLDEVKLVGVGVGVAGDSDSEWESVRSYDRKVKQMEEDLELDCGGGVVKRATNKYGINENELVVDLSVNVKHDQGREGEKVEGQTDSKPEPSERSPRPPTTEDNNNNSDGIVDNNNCSGGESISEVASEASSDVSSGYDVLHVPSICDDGEELSGGYVYITIDGNKLPVPRHILRPDFLATAEEAPPPEESAAAKVERAAEAEEESRQHQEAALDKSMMTHCSTTGSCFSDTTTGRLFIFPQNHPGYEVVPTTTETAATTDPSHFESCPYYSWAQSNTHYDLSSVNPSHLKSDPYGPLEQATAPPSPQKPPFVYECFPPGFHQQQHIQQQQQQQFQQQQQQHNAALQQFQQQQQSVTPEQSTVDEQPPQQQQPPLHILPENLVSGAVNVASSAINTARSVINMIVPPRPEPGRWVDGHWVTHDSHSIRAKNLCILAEMGFWDTDLNATLLARYKDDVGKVVSELIQ